jgi:hypothetical protein
MYWLLNIQSAENTTLKKLEVSYSRIHQIILETQTKYALEVALTLHKRGIKAPIFKGLAYELGKIGGEAIFNDIDFIISDKNLNETRATLGELGYSQNIVSHEGQVQLVSNDEISKFESLHYELFPFTKIVHSPGLESEISSIEQLGLTHPLVIEEGKTYIAVELDIHHNLSNGLDASEIIESTAPIASSNLILHQLDWETHVWFVAARLYHETMVLSSRKLRPLIDLGRIIENSNIDWKRIFHVSRKYALAPSLFYPLSWLADGFGINIPIDVLVALEHDRKNQELHDFGDFVPKALREEMLFRPL